LRPARRLTFSRSLCAVKTNSRRIGRGTADANLRSTSAKAVAARPISHAWIVCAVATFAGIARAVAVIQASVGARVAIEALRPVEPSAVRTDGGGASPPFAAVGVHPAVAGDTLVAVARTRIPSSGSPATARAAVRAIRVDEALIGPSPVQPAPVEFGNRSIGRRGFRACRRRGAVVHDGRESRAGIAFAFRLRVSMGGAVRRVGGRVDAASPAPPAPAFARREPATVEADCYDNQKGCRTDPRTHRRGHEQTQARLTPNCPCPESPISSKTLP
jgi:hypothetical protein